MKQFSLKVDSPVNGIYLNSETIDLLSIIQCKNIEELQNFVLECSQLNISEADMINWRENDIENIKRRLVEQYKKTLIPLKQKIMDRNSVVRSVLEHSGIYDEKYINLFLKGGYEGFVSRLQEENPEQYNSVAEKSHRFIASERDQIKSVTYEELLGLNENLHNHNTVLVASGRFYDVTKKLYNENIPNMEKYDFYHPKKALDFCYRNGMNVRYHTLLDKQTLEDHFKGKSKQEILKELKEYVKQSIDFISKYNEEHKINGKGIINSVDLFNEIISFDEPYRNMWQELYGISTQELVEVFGYAYDNKPDDVKYLYNEPFLENPERRKAVIDQLEEINKHIPLIDTLGSQMHIVMTQDIGEIKKCFYDLKKLEKAGIGIQITEFDMCLPEKFLFDEKGRISKKYSPEFIYNYKEQKIKEISDAINETEIQIEGITYWSVSDKLDHNLERTNTATYQKGLKREIANSRYAGLYTGLERSRTKSVEDLCRETSEEQTDVELIANIEKEGKKKKEGNKDLNEKGLF